MTKRRGCPRRWCQMENGMPRSSRHRPRLVGPDVREQVAVAQPAVGGAVQRDAAGHAQVRLARLRLARLGERDHPFLEHLLAARGDVEYGRRSTCCSSGHGAPKAATKRGE